MAEWKNACVGAQATVRDTLEHIDTGSMQIALVLDSRERLLGTVTDGDVRRALLRGITLEDPVEKVMNRTPTTAGLNDPREEILVIMKQRHLHQIPVVDDDGRVVRVELLDDLVAISEKTNHVVLMAGGVGSRLRPLTEDCPKPMLHIGNKPILETILRGFIEHGFRRFTICVNYKAEVIMEHFGDGSGWGITIDYVREPRSLGTAGALALIDPPSAEPIIVMNGDLLTKVNFSHLLDFHKAHQAAATMCVREYAFQVPYGVVRLDENRILAVEEKPHQRFFVSGGIYVLNPEVVQLLPKGNAFDMPDLFQRVVAEGGGAAAFPIREYWVDIGHLDDFHRAAGEFDRHFG